MSEHPWPRRVQRVLVGLTDEWRTFEQIYTSWSALDAKQHTGALVWLRNRRLVQSRFTRAGITQWRTTQKGSLELSP